MSKIVETYFWQPQFYQSLFEMPVNVPVRKRRSIACCKNEPCAGYLGHLLAFDGANKLKEGLCWLFLLSSQIFVVEGKEGRLSRYFALLS